jgi:hypothetical protein
MTRRKCICADPAISAMGVVIGQRRLGASTKKGPVCTAYPCLYIAHRNRKLEIDAAGNPAVPHDRKETDEDTSIRYHVNRAPLSLVELS